LRNWVLSFHINAHISMGKTPQNEGLGIISFDCGYNQIHPSCQPILNEIPEKTQTTDVVMTNESEDFG